MTGSRKRKSILAHVSQNASQCVYRCRARAVRSPPHRTAGQGTGLRAASPQRGRLPKRQKTPGSLVRARARDRSSAQERDCALHRGSQRLFRAAQRREVFTKGMRQQPSPIWTFVDWSRGRSCPPWMVYLASRCFGQVDPLPLSLFTSTKGHPLRQS